MGDGKRKFRRGMGNQTRSSRFVILDYRSPEGSQSIDNTEEFERVQRCVDEGKDPYEGRHSYYGFGMRRKHLSEPTAILNYRSPEGSQSIETQLLRIRYETQAPVGTDGHPEASP